MTEDQKTEIVTRARAVVNKVQLKDLHAVISLLEEDIFTDPQKRYFLLVDRLDEEWVEDSIRYKLIKSIIEAVRAFRKIRTVKILVAMRTDLLHRVITETKDAGFQEEKHESLYLRIRWNRVT